MGQRKCLHRSMEIQFVLYSRLIAAEMLWGVTWVENLIHWPICTSIFKWRVCGRNTEFGSEKNENILVNFNKILNTFPRKSYSPFLATFPICPPYKFPFSQNRLWPLFAATKQHFWVISTKHDSTIPQTSRNFYCDSPFSGWQREWVVR